MKIYFRAATGLDAPDWRVELPTAPSVGDSVVAPNGDSYTVRVVEWNFDRLNNTHRVYVVLG